ncbi:MULTISPECIES: hypothetical protein [Micrococcaceae]|uniref:hypothetical protein n=1 Tax=Micrococcaceae TaxID=1268 RepID=UPI0013EF6EBC|nr:MULTISPECIES: hypothetical protein [Micrococcaceae]UXN32457.1 hypothetical protein N6V40_02975 [Glutamicibacter sp. M10]
MSAVGDGDERGEEAEAEADEEVVRDDVELWAVDSEAEQPVSDKAAMTAITVGNL